MVTVPRICAGLGLVAGCLFLLNMGSPPNREPNPAPAGNALKPASVVGRPIPLHRAPRESRPAPAHQLAVFPDLREPVSDWRRFSPHSFVVRLAPAVEASFRVDQVEERRGLTVITARLDRESGSPSYLDSVFLVGTASTPDQWNAVAVFPGIEYHIEIRQGRSQVDEVPMEDFFCESCQHGHAAQRSADDGMPVAAALHAADTAPGSQWIVDVLFLYNAEALAERAGDVHRIGLDCANYIASANAMLANSGITAFRWRSRAAVATPTYAISADLGEELRAMSGNGAIASFVRDQQSTLKADQVVLLSGGAKTGGSGVAWAHGPALHAAVNYPFTTNSSGVRSTSTTSTLLMSHELMHNFGAFHGRDDPGTPAPVDGDGFFNYGHAFSDATFTPSRPTATIMASGGVRIPHFSNPDISYNGNPTGVPVGQPRAAHVARMAAEFAPLAAAASDAESPPVITQPLASVSVTAGETLTLTVAASGGGETYRWFKDETLIRTTIGSTLSIPNVTMADAGAYGVVAVNFLGARGSGPATVTVLAPPPPPPPPTPPVGGAGSGGGGGGGAAPGWLALTLTALLIGRRLVPPQWAEKAPILKH